MFTSDFILNETHEKLVEKFGYAADLAEDAMSLLRSRMELVAPTKLERQICLDPDDENILAAAMSGKCDCIVTGDRVLLVLKSYEGIDILGPRDFIANESLGREEPGVSVK